MEKSYEVGLEMSCQMDLAMDCATLLVSSFSSFFCWVLHLVGTMPFCQGANLHFFLQAFSSGGSCSHSESPVCHCLVFLSSQISLLPVSPFELFVVAAPVHHCRRALQSNLGNTKSSRISLLGWEQLAGHGTFDATNSGIHLRTTQARRFSCGRFRRIESTLCHTFCTHLCHLDNKRHTAMWIFLRP